MKTFKSLNQLFAAAKKHQITAQELINERSFVFGQWQNIKLTDELKNEVINQILSILGGWEKNKKYIEYNLRNSSPQHWGLTRILLSKYGKNNASFSYCAGQSYPDELKSIRKYLQKC